MTSDEMRQLPSHYPRCFGCGEEHPTGLRLEMSGGNSRVEGSFLVTEHHQGAPGLAHGGVLSAAVDEGMGYLLWLLATPAVTAHLEIDFKRPVPVGSRLLLKGELEKVDGRKIFTRMVGVLDGDVVIEAKALFLKVTVEHFVPHMEKIGMDSKKFDKPYNP